MSKAIFTPHRGSFIDSINAQYEVTNLYDLYKKENIEAPFEAIQVEKSGLYDERLGRQRYSVLVDGHCIGDLNRYLKRKHK